jgi:hypothetical protein
MGGPFCRILFIADLLLESVDLNRHIRHGRYKRLAVDHAEVRDHMTNLLVADDFNFRPKDGIAVRMVPVKVRVDHPADRLVVISFISSQERPPRGWRRPGVYQKHGGNCKRRASALNEPRMFCLHPLDALYLTRSSPDRYHVCYCVVVFSVGPVAQVARAHP